MLSRSRLRPKRFSTTAGFVRCATITANWRDSVAASKLRIVVEDDSHHRWVRDYVHLISGTYGDHLLGKVSKVFPQ